MRRLIVAVVIVVSGLVLLISVLTLFVQPILPAWLNIGGYWIFVALAAVVAFLAALNDIFQLFERFLPQPQAPDTNSKSNTDQQRDFYQVPSAEIRQELVETTLRNRAVVDHDELFGVEEKLSNINLLLNDSESSWIISLFGEGGIGKTALAYEAVFKYAAEAGFTRLAWVSAKQQYISAGQGTSTSETTQLLWEDLIWQIAEQLHLQLGFSSSDWLFEFRKEIKKLPSGEKCLIIIDNLETVEDVRVIRYFDPEIEPSKKIVDPHKLIVTTRKSIASQHSSVVELLVTQLEPHFAYDLIRSLGESNPALYDAKDEQLKPMLEVTEGNPLLIKLVTRRFLVSRKPLSKVLEELKEVENIGVAAEWKDYLYQQSLEELAKSVGDLPAMQIMKAFCPIPAGERLSYDQLQTYCPIEDSALFDRARQLACDLSLIRVTQSLDDPRYSIHSLLHEFTCKTSE